MYLSLALNEANYFVRYLGIRAMYNSDKASGFFNRLSPQTTRQSAIILQVRIESLCGMKKTLYTHKSQMFEIKCYGNNCLPFLQQHEL